MEAVWLVHGRQLAGRFRFWFSLSGYDPNDHSLGHKLYLGYALVFWLLWLFAVLAFFSGMVARGFAFLHSSGLMLQPADVLTGLAIGLFLFQVYRGARTCPMIFSEDDAHLICSTPVKREAVALAWFAGAVPTSGMPFWIAAVILAFSLVETRLAGVVEWSDAPEYLGTGFRALFVTIPFYAGLVAGVWAISLARVGGLLSGRVLRVGIIFLAVLWVVLQYSGFSLFSSGLILPVRIPVEAALTGSQIWIGFGLGVFLLAAGVLLLVRAAGRVSLSRIAQETMGTEARQSAALAMNPGLSSELDLRGRLGMGQRPFPLAGWPGGGALVWKRLLQAWRGKHIGGLWNWGSLILFAGGVLTAPNTAARLFSAVLWALTVCQRSASVMEKDLQRWNPLRTLPIAGGSLTLATGLLPGAAALLMTWLACLAGVILGAGVLAGWLAVLAPGMILCLSLAAQADILRRAKSQELVADISPTLELMGLALGVAALALPVIPAWWLWSQGLAAGAALLMAGIGHLSLGYLLWRFGTVQWRHLLAPEPA